MSTLNKVEFTQCMITPNDVEYYLKNNPDGIGGAESGVDKPDLEDEKDVSDKFPDLAKSKSIHTPSAKNGGQIGYIRKGTILPEIENVSFSINFLRFS